MSQPLLRPGPAASVSDWDAKIMAVFGRAGGHPSRAELQEAGAAVTRFLEQSLSHREIERRLQGMATWRAIRIQYELCRMLGREPVEHEATAAAMLVSNWLMRGVTPSAIPHLLFQRAGRWALGADHAEAA